MKKLIIAVDFDGCIVSEAYPNIGVVRNGALEVMQKWSDQGHTIIINTCRSDKYEQDAYKMLIEKDFHFSYFNSNDPKLIKKYGSDCRKISADLYLDDRNFGGFIGWKKADEIVQQKAMSKPLILCLIGESGSGKTTWAEHIEREFGIPLIQSHTDRDKRYPEENGHIFWTPEEFDKLNKDEMIAYTKFGDRRYCCLHKDVRDVNVYVIDEHGYNLLRERHLDKYDVVSIRVTCPEKIRRERVGDERVNRDFGMFPSDILTFDHELETDRSKETTESNVNVLVKGILYKYKPFAFHSETHAYIASRSMSCDEEIE